MPGNNMGFFYSAKGRGGKATAISLHRYVPSLPRGTSITLIRPPPVVVICMYRICVSFVHKVLGVDMGGRAFGHEI